MKLLLASTSSIHGHSYLSYFKDAWTSHFKDIYGPVVFIPYARPGGLSLKKYTQIAAAAFNSQGIELRGIQTFDNPQQAVENAGGFFCGGGNTFVLLKTLLENKTYEHIDRSVREGKPYMGSSAGSNIAGKTIGTTNDMPIVYPPKFDSFNWVPFNINPHYIDGKANTTHKGETRQTRIQEFHEFNETPVLGLREGSWIESDGIKHVLKGELSARIFQPNNDPIEIPNGILRL
tara:strand:+ start:972 stop:1670 length:699 start_codon:yes stop_codon:yes gene_type:complete